MADRICSLCGLDYTDEKRHNYDECVNRCRERLNRLMTEVEDAKTHLHKAQEIQAQDWWRKGG